MENQTPPQAPTMAGRPWFRLISMRASETPLATGPPAPVAEPPRPATPPPPATERPLLRLGSLLSRSTTAPTSAVPPPQQEPPAQAPPQTQPPTPPPAVPTSGTPPRPPALPTPLATAALTQEQQPPSQALRSTPSSVVRPPSPPAPPAPQSLTVIRLPETTLRPPPPPPPTTTVSPPPPPPPPMRSTLTPPAPAAPSPRLPSPPLRTLSPLAPPAPLPRLPSPPPYPEPETKPVVSVVTSQSVRTPEPTNGLYKDRNSRINGNSNGNGNGGQKTQGGQLIKGVVTPHLPPPTSTPKKADPAEPAAVPGKKKSGSSDEAESRMRVLTLAGENMGAYMNLGSGVHRGNTVKGHDRHLTQSQTATQSIEKVAVAPGSNGTGDASLDVQNYSAAKDVKASTGASKWKAGAASAKPMAALVNSNVQSVNNSIMFNSSCTQQSPGVYITLSSGSRRPSSSLAVAGDGNGHSDGKTGIGKDNARADH